jgi:hypothetical protein
MGIYVYKTSPALTKIVTVELSNGCDQVKIEAQLYEFAYKPYHNYEIDQKLHNRFVAPSIRAFEKRGIKPYPYGALSHNGMPAIGDPVFKTNHTIAFHDDLFFSEQNYSEVGKIVAIGKKKMVA